MCTGAEVPLILALLGTGVSVAGQIQQGETQNKIAENNATALRYQAQSANEAGAVAEQTHRLKVQQLLSSQTAAAGASGADVGSQSFGKVMDQTATMGELDAQTIRMNALREAWGLKTQALSQEYSGKAAKAAGYAGALGTALTGFGKAASMTDWAKTPAKTK